MKTQNFILIRKKIPYMRLSLRRDGTPLVYAPKRSSIKEIEAFVNEHLPKLLEYEQKAKEKNLLTVFEDTQTPTLMFLGKRYPVTRSNGAFFSFNEKEFRVSDTFNDKQLISAYREFLRLRSREIVSKIVKSYANEYDLTYNNITFKEIYSRLGSCSSNGNLNFTLALSACDEKFIHFITTHELAHLKHMNHSKDFHAFHRTLFPELDKITAEMKTEYNRFCVALCTIK